MPRIHSYSDKDGLYILARPPGAGNITYQVSSKGQSILQNIGLSAGDEIGWDIINALRVPELIYTGESGTIAENEPPLDFEVEEKAVNRDFPQRQDFVRLLFSRVDLDRDSKNKISSILRVDLDAIVPPKQSLDVEIQPHHMDNSLESVNAENWHPQDVILVCEALLDYAESGELTDARASRAYALLFGLIDTSDIQFDHTDFSDYQHLSDIVDKALKEWMAAQADSTWGEELLSEED